MQKYMKLQVRNTLRGNLMQYELHLLIGEKMGHKHIPGEEPAPSEAERAPNPEVAEMYSASIAE